MADDGTEAEGEKERAVIFVLPELIAHHEKAVGQVIAILHRGRIALKPIRRRRRGEAQHASLRLCLGPETPEIIRRSLAAEYDRLRQPRELDGAALAGREFRFGEIHTLGLLAREQSRLVGIVRRAFTG